MFTELFEKLGEVYEREKKLIKNKKLYDAYVLLKNRDELEAVFLVGIIFILLRKYEEAIVKFESIVKSEEFYKLNLIKKDVFFEIIGVCYFESGNFLEASKWFVQSVSIDPNNANSSYNLACIYIINKDFKNAYEILVRLREKEPTNIKILNNISSIEKKMAEKSSNY